jgi:hypothetical protein
LAAANLSSRYAYGGERFAGAGGHLDEGARVSAAKGLFEVANGAPLDVPEAALVQGREVLEAGAELRWLRDEFRESIRTREVEYLAAPWRRVEPVGRIDHGTVGFEEEGQRAPMRRQVVRQPGGILGGLRLNASERSVRLGFDGTERFAIQI